MSKGFGKNKNLTKDLLLKLALVGCFVIAAGSPFFLTGLLQHYFKDKSRKTTWRRSEKLKELAKKKIISVKEQPDGSIKIELSHKGQTIVRNYKIDEIKINKPKRWDKNWRVIIYDIPHHLKNARDAFRKKLKDLGLYQLQKSVWVSPYDCLPEIEFLCGVFNLSLDKHVLYFSTPDIPNKLKLIKYFELRFVTI